MTVSQRTLRTTAGLVSYWDSWQMLRTCSSVVPKGIRTVREWHRDIEPSQCRGRPRHAQRDSSHRPRTRGAPGSAAEVSVGHRVPAHPDGRLISARTLRVLRHCAATARFRLLIGPSSDLRLPAPAAKASFKGWPVGSDRSRPKGKCLTSRMSGSGRRD
jgi:hypothetical protein